MSRIGVLLRHGVRRLSASVRRPTAGGTIGVLLPSLLLVVGVVAAGARGGARLESTQDGVTLGVLLGSPVAFVAYSVIFRMRDESFLRRLGVEPRVLYIERALRLLAFAVGVALLALLGYGAAGVAADRVLRVALPVAVVAWGMALLFVALAARTMTVPGGRGGPAWLSMGMWDREVAAAAPLVYAPIPALVAAGVGGGIVTGVEANVLAPVAVAGAGLVAALAGARPYGAALPRFAPRAMEMSFAPEPEAIGLGLPGRRGLSRLLPRAAAAARARDVAVAGRRFAWAGRVTWPVVILSLVALARWGREPGVTAWVGSAVVLALALQGAAAIGLGRLERGGSRWLDRAAGITPLHRFLGRWGWGWGLGLWLTVPLALAWGWWSEAGSGWGWVVVAAFTSAVAAAASVLSAGRR